MRTIICCLGTFLLFAIPRSYAGGNDTLLSARNQFIGDGGQPANFIKINPFGLIINNYGLQAERVLSRRLSLCLGVRIMPERSLPLKSQFKYYFDDLPSRTLEDMRLGNFALTPELRLYLGKGYGRGFYLAPYYRYATFRADDINIYDPDTDDRLTQLEGRLTTNSVGLLIGSQWAIGRFICLDWHILGGHFGSAKGTVSGSYQELTEEEQQDIREILDRIETPITDIDYTVGPTRTTVRLDGIWAGLRMGFSIGIRF